MYDPQCRGVNAKLAFHDLDARPCIMHQGEWFENACSVIPWDSDKGVPRLFAKRRTNHEHAAVMCSAGLFGGSNFDPCFRESWLGISALTHSKP